MLGEDEKFTPGKKYEEAIGVTNSGNIDTFVRVIITKSWQDADGNKNTTLSPDLIELNYLTDNGWTIAEDQSTPERTVLYYTKAVGVGESTPALSDTLRINQSIASEVTKTVKDTQLLIVTNMTVIHSMWMRRLMQFRHTTQKMRSRVPGVWM